MRTSRSSRVAGARFGLVMLAGLLALGARQAGAQYDSSARQASDTAPMTLIVAVLPGPAGAKQAFDAMPAAQRGNLESYAVVSKDQNGKVTVQEKPKKKSHLTLRRKKANKSVNAVSTGLAQPPSGGAKDSTGYAGGAQAGIPAAEMSQIQSALTPGNSAIILVADDPSVNDVDSAMQQAKAEPVIHVRILTP